MLQKARERLIFALDVNTADEAENLVRMLASEAGAFKVGLELFISQGPEILARLRRGGLTGWPPSMGRMCGRPV